MFFAISADQYEEALKTFFVEDSDAPITEFKYLHIEKKYFSSGGAYNLDKYHVDHEENSDKYEDESYALNEPLSSFFLFYSTSKVTSREDYRSLSDLYSTFPSVDRAQVDIIYNKNRQNFGTAFDILSSILKSHPNGILPIPASNFLDDLSSWPLLHSYSKDLAKLDLNLMKKSPFEKISQCLDRVEIDNGWSIISSIDCLSISDINNNEASVESQYFEANGTSDDRDWEVVECSNAEAENVTASTVSDANSISPRVRSYKDILISNAGLVESKDTNVIKNVISAKKWNPTFVVTDTPRRLKTRLYGPQPDSAIFTDGDLFSLFKFSSTLSVRL
jgi:hypothetical protein